MYIYQTVFVLHRTSVESVVMALIDERIFWFVALISSFGWLVSFYKKKTEKAEQDFHALRCEFIQKSNELLQERAWEKRHVLYEWMKKTHDISLYHENK
ncbi:DUF2663 family protein [Anoxybacillus sp. KU2-6(11)]|nr:DUF2663 family protein [Anoxybacillus sp. KU2-6(11)]